MDRLEAMGAFVAVAERKGFAAAARHLGLSPSTVTRLIAALEERLGVQLLRRTTRSVALTDAGARYLERARRIVADVGEAERAARAQRTTPSGRFVVAAPNVFGRREVAPLMSAYLAKYPAVIGELRLGDRYADLVEEGIDVAVRIGALDDSTLVARRVGETRRVVVGAPSYFERRRPPRTPRDLPGHALVQFTNASSVHARGVAEWLFSRDGVGDERISIAPSFVTNSADVAIAHAERGGGLARVLGYQVAAAVKSGKLEIVLAKHEPAPLPIQLVYSSARVVSANIRAFVDLTVGTRRWSFVDL